MASDNASKRLKTAPLRIGTHNGTFHADEALAVYMLRLLPEYQDATLTRSRDPTILEECDIIVDVQGQYDGTKHFDHHQRTFSETFSPEHKTKLSSAGLIYKHFARNIISQRLSLPPTSPSTDLLYNKIYNDFIEALDANDNGISAYPSTVTPAFNDKSISIPSLIGSFNLAWNEPSDSTIEDTRFLSASSLIGETFIRKLDFYGKSWLPARDLVVAAVDSRLEYDAAGRLVVLQQAIPWRDHLFTLEKERGIEEGKGPLYVLYPEGPGKGWRIQAVPVSKDSFQSRKALPEAWRGARDEKLSEITGVPGGVFIHANGFTGGNKTYEGVFEMAKKALEL